MWEFKKSETNEKKISNLKLRVINLKTYMFPYIKIYNN